MKKPILILALSTLIVACGDGMKQSKPPAENNSRAKETTKITTQVDQTASTEKAKLATQAEGD